MMGVSVQSTAATVLHFFAHKNVGPSLGGGGSLGLGRARAARHKCSQECRTVAAIWNTWGNDSDGPTFLITLWQNVGQHGSDGPTFWTFQTTLCRTVGPEQPRQRRSYIHKCRTVAVAAHKLDGPTFLCEIA